MKPQTTHRMKPQTTYRRRPHNTTERDHKLPPEGDYKILPEGHHKLPTEGDHKLPPVKHCSNNVSRVSQFASSFNHFDGLSVTPLLVGQSLPFCL